MHETHFFSLVVELLSCCGVQLGIFGLLDRGDWNSWTRGGGGKWEWECV